MRCVAMTTRQAVGGSRGRAQSASEVGILGSASSTARRLATAKQRPAGASQSTGRGSEGSHFPAKPLQKYRDRTQPPLPFAAQVSGESTRSCSP